MEVSVDQPGRQISPTWRQRPRRHRGCRQATIETTNAASMTPTGSHPQLTPGEVMLAVTDGGCGMARHCPASSALFTEFRRAPALLPLRHRRQTAAQSTSTAGGTGYIQDLLPAARPDRAPARGDALRQRPTAETSAVEENRPSSRCAMMRKAQTTRLAASPPRGPRGSDYAGRSAAMTDVVVPG